MIFKAELEGLQQITAQNVRLRVGRLDFCERWGQLSDYAFTRLPDDRIEFSIGDLVSQEDRIMVLLMEVLPLPLLNGQTRSLFRRGEASGGGDSMGRDRGKGNQVVPARTGDPSFSALRMPRDVKLNEETVAWVAVQRAGKAVDEATKDIDSNKTNEAKAKLQQALDALKRYRLDDKAADGIRLLQDFSDTIGIGPVLGSGSERGELLLLILP